MSSLIVSGYTKTSRKPNLVSPTFCDLLLQDTPGIGGEEYPSRMLPRVVKSDWQGHHEITYIVR